MILYQLHYTWWADFNYNLDVRALIRWNEKWGWSWAALLLPADLAAAAGALSLPRAADKLIKSGRVRWLDTHLSCNWGFRDSLAPRSIHSPWLRRCSLSISRLGCSCICHIDYCRQRAELGASPQKVGVDYDRWHTIYCTAGPCVRPLFPPGPAWERQACSTPSTGTKQILRRRHGVAANFFPSDIFIAPKP